MAEKIIYNHAQHLKELTKNAMSNRAEPIKELVDYLILAHASG